MTEVKNKMHAALQAVWQRRWLAAGVAWGISVLGFVVVAMVPDRYEATARVYVNTQTVLKPLMAGLTFQPDIDQQVQMLARTVVSRPNVERLLELPEVDLNTEVHADRERTIDRVMDRIKFASTGGNLYVISYRDTEAPRAKAIVAGLLSLFVDSSTGAKQRDSQDAGAFIDEQIKSYDTKLAEAENRLKDFKIRNFGVTGVSDQNYYARTSALAEEVSKLSIALGSAEHSRDALRRELFNEDPRLPPDAMMGASMNAQPNELDARIETQQKQLDELLRRYTDQHPDVVNARRIVGQLEAQRASEGAAKAREGGGRKTGSAATSPVYQRIRISLADAEANVASLRSQAAAQQRRLQEMRATSSKVPQAEAELAQLNRDYDIVRKQYDLLVTRREAASLGLKVDKSSQLADFRTIEPPRVAPRAVFPDRRALAVAAMLLALSSGISLAYLLSQLAPRFVSVRALQDFSRRPVLSSIGFHPNAQTMAAARREVFKYAGVLGAFVVFHAVWIVLVSRLAPLLS